MTWFVVKFDDDNTARHIIVDFIKKKQCPGTDWVLYDASLLGSYGKIYFKIFSQNT